MICYCVDLKYKKLRGYYKNPKVSDKKIENQDVFTNCFRLSFQGFSTTPTVGSMW